MSIKKTWSYNGHDYEMSKTGYGQYVLNGYHCTNSTIWDYVDDEENEEEKLAALKEAEAFVEFRDQHYSFFGNCDELSEPIELEFCNYAFLEDAVSNAKWLLGNQTKTSYVLTSVSIYKNGEFIQEVK